MRTAGCKRAVGNERLTAVAGFGNLDVSHLLMRATAVNPLDRSVKHFRANADFEQARLLHDSDIKIAKVNAYVDALRARLSAKTESERIKTYKEIQKAYANAMIEVSQYVAMAVVKMFQAWAKVESERELTVIQNTVEYTEINKW